MALGGWVRPSVNCWIMTATLSWSISIPSSEAICVVTVSPPFARRMKSRTASSCTLDFFCISSISRRCSPLNVFIVSILSSSARSFLCTSLAFASLRELTRLWITTLSGALSFISSILLFLSPSTSSFLLCALSSLDSCTCFARSRMSSSRAFTRFTRRSVASLDSLSRVSTPPLSVLCSIFGAVPFFFSSYSGGGSGCRARSRMNMFLLSLAALLRVTSGTCCHVGSFFTMCAWAVVLSSTSSSCFRRSATPFCINRSSSCILLLARSFLAPRSSASIALSI
mmetsp:Transcript_37317/g.90692  ORF Transcript_37317/g.90692 Transcript_37317/m.90692 type:complete len:283 (-) Transcript_37317:1232-2080(-)